MKNIVLGITVGFIVGLLVGLIILGGLTPKAEAGTCKHENAECQWNNSRHNCCPGLDCNFWKMGQGHAKYKCKPQVTPTPTPTVTPTPSLTPTPTPTPTVPEVTPTPTETPCIQDCGNPPTFAGSSTEPPKCGEADIATPIANPHVYRNGDKAIVKWFPTAGNKVHIYYKDNSSNEWQYSVTTDNTGYFEINGLGKRDITFAIQQVEDCSGGVIVSAISMPIVDGGTNGWTLWR